MPMLTFELNCSALLWGYLCAGDVGRFTRLKGRRSEGGQASSTQACIQIQHLHMEPLHSVNVEKAKKAKVVIFIGSVRT